LKREDKMREFFAKYARLIATETGKTLYMMLFSTVFSYILGLPMGVMLYATKTGGILENRKLNKILSRAVGILRSFPFIILTVVLMPLTRAIVGKAIGPTAAIFPLTVGAAPFVARMVESSLEEVDKGVIEACLCMGATPFDIITKVLISESLPGLIRGFAITAVTLVGYIAIVGSLGAGGLGDVAIRYGHNRRIESVMWFSVAVIMAIVFLIQAVFEKLAKKSDKRNIL
jgi:D-methionine transport system permease protein